jgi:TolB protein
MIITVRTGLAAAVGLAALLLVQPSSFATTREGAAAGAALDRPVVYARGGAIYTSAGNAGGNAGGAERRLTGAGANSRPRLAPDRRTVAYLRAGELWQMNADGRRKHRVVAGAAAGAAYSPDGQWLAYAARDCLGGQGVYRVRARVPHGRPEALFPAVCRTEAVPEPAPAAARSGPAARSGSPARALADRLRHDDAVAWSPDGTRIAFPAGACESLYDDCLTVGTVDTGTETLIAGFGGGGAPDGYAVLPAWAADGATLAWTEYSGDGLHVVEAAADGSDRRQIGAAQDRELVYAGSGRALVTAQHRGRSWVVLLDLATGERVPVRPGSQPSV